MKILPSYQLSVLNEEDYQENMTAISEQLDQVRQEGTFSGFDGKPLYYEYFQAQESRGAVVVVHGLSEFTKKYLEFSWYFLNQGYDVFLYDQRGHGHSCRLTDQPDMIHVDAFSHYSKDLHCFIADVVSKATDKPLYLYAHSMGCAVALQYLAQHPQVFVKAALSAPMIEPLTGSVSPRVARFGLGAYMLVSKGTKRFWRTNDFDPDYPFERSQDQSRSRFQWNMHFRLADECYHTTPMSFRWVQQSLSLRPKLMRSSFLKKLCTPILMLSAQKDTVVNAQAQEAFAEKCPNCRRIVIKDTTHGMLSGTQETVTAHIRLVLDHFA